MFIETREEQLIPALLAGNGDVAANLLLTFARDEQVAFAPPIVAQIRELIGTPADCANAICWLAGDASAKTTGHVIPVDGGLPDAFLR